MAGPGARGEGGGEPVRAQEADQGEQVGLLGVAVQPQGVDGVQPGRSEPGGEPLHQGRVAGAASGGQHLDDPVGAQGVGDGDGGELDQGGEQVAVLGSARRAQGRLQVVGPEQLRTGRLGRGLPVVGLGQQVVQELGDGGAGAGEPPIDVEVGGPVGDQPHGGVEQGVGRAGVEGQGISPRAYDGHVGDPAEVERGGGLVPLAQQQGVQDGGQRGALSARGDVGGARAREHGGPGGLGDPGGSAHLEGAVHGGPLGPVEERLPVRGDQVGPAFGEGLHAGQRGPAELAPDQGVEPADRLQGGRRRWQGRTELPP